MVNPALLGKRADRRNDADDEPEGGKKKTKEGLVAKRTNQTSRHECGAAAETSPEFWKKMRDLHTITHDHVKIEFLNADTNEIASYAKTMAMFGEERSVGNDDHTDKALPGHQL